jgi:predicted lipoprotein with Yx(FWY)xxD motif
MRTTLRAGLAAVLAAGAVSCAAPAPAATPAAPPASVATAGPTTAGPVSLQVVPTALGDAVGTGGWVLYRFEADAHDPPASLCENDCLRVWPPVLTDGTPPVLDGIDPALVGTLRRPDGTTQVTLRGWPLYRFVDDTRPGTTQGENVGGNWSVIGPDGRALVKK